jgi:ABC-type transport system involved in multi-copper enzyme maturation permease subunit
MTNKTLTIAYYTFKELFKSKVLYGVFFIGLAILISVYIASEFTYGASIRVAIDVGLGLLSLSSLGIALFLGVGLISKEIESRTVYIIVSRPVSRFQFISGKILGLMAILFLNILILTSMIVASTYLLDAKFEGLLLWSVFFTFIESFLLLLIVVFFSLITNNIMSAIYSIVLLLVGHIIVDTQEIVFVKMLPALGQVLKFYHYVLPGFYKLNIKDFVIYKQSLPAEYLLGSAAYGATYSAFVFCLIIFLFNRKNLD